MTLQEYTKMLEEKYSDEFSRKHEEDIEQILDGIDIKDIEKYLRKKKLQQIQNEKK